MAKDYHRLYDGALATIKEKDEQLAEQAREISLLGNAAFEVRSEDAEQLADFQATNKTIIEFIEKIAQGRTKHRDEARKILGY